MFITRGESTKVLNKLVEQQDKLVEQQDKLVEQQDKLVEQQRQIVSRSDKKSLIAHDTQQLFLNSLTIVRPYDDLVSQVQQMSGCGNMYSGTVVEKVGRTKCR